MDEIHIVQLLYPFEEPRIIGVYSDKLRALDVYHAIDTHMPDRMFHVQILSTQINHDAFHVEGVMFEKGEDGYCYRRCSV